jgi:hypothetical protein
MEKFGKWLISYFALLNSNPSQAALVAATLVGAAHVDEIIRPGGEGAGDPTLTKMGQGLVLLAAAIKTDDYVAAERLSVEFLQLAEQVRTVVELLREFNDALGQAAPALERAVGMIGRLQNRPRLLATIGEAARVYNATMQILCKTIKVCQMSTPVDVLLRCVECTRVTTASFLATLDEIESHCDWVQGVKTLQQGTTGQC